MNVSQLSHSATLERRLPAPPPPAFDVNWIDLERARAVVAEWEWASQPAWLVYTIYGAGEVLYVGMTGNLRQRMKSHQRNKDFFGNNGNENEVVQVSIYQCRDKAHALKLEAAMIEDMRPSYNVAGVVVSDD